MQIYITFGLYLAIILGIGLYAYRSTQNFDDYILGGRKMGSFVTAMSAGASDMSGWLLMGLPGAIFLSGLTEAWIAVGLTIGAYLNYRVVAGRLRIFTEKYSNALTLPEFFAQRFPRQKKALKIISSGIILFFFTIYCASGVVAGAKLFQSFLGLEYSTALWLGALATITYTFIGGYLAVSWSDTIQASLMIFALIFAPISQISSHRHPLQQLVTQCFRHWCYFCAGLGLGLFRTTTHSCPFHGGGFRSISRQSPSNRDLVDVPLPWRCCCRRVFRISLFHHQKS